MTEIVFPDLCLMTAQERWHTIFQFLKEHKQVDVEFTKVNGEHRCMPCTTDDTLMTPEARIRHHRTRIIDYETMHVWCLDKQAWRAFKTMNVISMKAKDD